MGEQGRLAVAVESGQPVPQVSRRFRQPLRPLIMPHIDRLGRGSFRQARRLRREAGILRCYFQACAGSVSIKGAEAEGVQHCLERHLRIVCDAIPQRQRAVRRQLGDQPI